MKLLTCCLCITSVLAGRTRQVAEFPLKAVAVVDFEAKYPKVGGGTEPALVVTAFGPRTGEVYSLGSLAGVISSGGSSAKLTKLAEQTWPNEAELAPPNAVAGCAACVVVAGGFLVPGNEDGLVYLYNVSDPSSPVPSANPVSTLKKSSARSAR